MASWAQILCNTHAGENASISAAIAGIQRKTDEMEGERKGKIGRNRQPRREGTRHMMWVA